MSSRCGCLFERLKGGVGLFGCVIQDIDEQCANVLIGKCVVNVLRFAPPGDEAGRVQHLQSCRNAREFGLIECHQFGYTHFATRQPLQETQPRRIAHCTAHGRREFELLRRHSLCCVGVEANVRTASVVVNDGSCHNYPLFHEFMECLNHFEADEVIAKARS